MKRFLTIAISILLMFSLVACGTTGSQGPQGETGATGPQGPSGITPQLKVGEDNYWYVSYDNGTTWASLNVKATGTDGNQGPQGEQGIQGEQGPQGEQGNDGLSAFEIFKKYYPGYTGTEEEWIYAIATNDICSLFGHTTVIDKAVQATCTTEGLTEGSHCEICEKVLVKQEVIEASHNYIGTVCSVCGFDCDTHGFELILRDDGESYYVKSYNGTDLHPIIPSVYNDKPVTAIAEHAFNGLWSDSSFITMEIPDSITHIGYSAFNYCRSLKSITIPASVISIGKSVVNEGSANTTIFAGCDSLESIVVDENNPIYDSRGGCNAIVETATNRLVSGCKNSIITLDIATIGFSAFGYLNSLTNIQIPQNVKEIEYGAFMECVNLTEVTYTGNKKQWSEISIDNSLSSNSWLLNATLICTGVDEPEKDSNQFIYESNGDGTSSIVGMATIISIPSETPDGEAINRIAPYTFSNLKNIIIEMPSTIQMIDDYAFDNCEIKEIRFSGTCEEWYNIYKNDGSWNYNSHGFTVICSDGEITY